MSCERLHSAESVGIGGMIGFGEINQKNIIFMQIYSNRIEFAFCFACCDLDDARLPTLARTF